MLASRRALKYLQPLCYAMLNTQTNIFHTAWLQTCIMCFQTECSVAVWYIYFRQRKGYKYISTFHES
jgi:hypothetical protein